MEDDRRQQNTQSECPAAMTRRQFLAGAAAVGAFLGAGGLGLLSSARGAAAGADAKGDLPAWPWPYKKLDPDVVAKRAYESYFKGGCCYGAAKGMIDELAAQVGHPYPSFPVDMLRYGGGGVAGWGTLCGALNGAAAVTNLVTGGGQANKLISELMGWYTTFPFPEYVPDGKSAMTTTVAGSPLCHASVTGWCRKTGHEATSPERAERCARLTADVAKRAVVLLNQHADGTFVPKHVMTEGAAGCLSCHGKDGINDTKATMDCLQCHDAH